MAEHALRLVVSLSCLLAGGFLSDGDLFVGMSRARYTEGAQHSLTAEWSQSSVSAHFHGAPKCGVALGNPGMLSGLQESGSTCTCPGLLLLPMLVLKLHFLILPTGLASYSSTNCALLVFALLT